MSATNSTPIINLPLFIGTDKPAWLTDWNGAMNTIDTAIANLQTAESGTATSLASLAQSVEALSGTVSQHTTAIQTVTTATATNTGSINTINSLIGNGTPTTTDQTIIGAINELHADQGNLADLTTPAASLVSAINAITGGGGAVTASAVSYDNTQSDLTATNVQDAIDEMASNDLGADVDLTAYNSIGSAYVTPSDGFVLCNTSDAAAWVIVRIYGSTATLDSDAHSACGARGLNDLSSCYVKKGMKLFIYNKTQTAATAIFTPIN